MKRDYRQFIISEQIRFLESYNSSFDQCNLVSILENVPPERSISPSNDNLSSPSGVFVLPTLDTEL